MPNTVNIYESYPLKVLKANGSKSSHTHKNLFKSRESDSITFLPNLEFSEREIDILQLMAFGKTAHEVAEKLYISPHTVKTHQKNMLKKTGCNNSTHLIASCLRSGVIS